MADDPRIREAAVALAWRLDLPWFKKAALGRDMTPLAEVAVTAADRVDPLRALLADEDRAVEFATPLDRAAVLIGVDVPRLIADLRASRAREAELAVSAARLANDARRARVRAGRYLAERDALQQRINKALAEHRQYLPAAVNFDCCEACNRASSGYVPYPCPVRTALTGTEPDRA